MGYEGKTERLEMPAFEYLKPEDYDSVVAEFEGSLPDDAQVIIAEYEYEDYSGWGYVLYYSGGKLYEVTGSHCSCYGLEGQWSPEETSVKAILMRHSYNIDGEYRDNRVQQWHDFISTPEPKIIESLRDHPLASLFFVGLDGSVKVA